MRIPFTQVDAFADAAFGGNPAAVMLLSEKASRPRPVSVEGMVTSPLSTLK